MAQVEAIVARPATLGAGAVSVQHSCEGEAAAGRRAAGGPVAARARTSRMTREIACGGAEAWRRPTRSSRGTSAGRWPPSSPPSPRSP